MKTLLAVLFFTFVGVPLSARYMEDLLLPSDKICLQELGMDAQIFFDNFSDDFLVTEGNNQLNEFHECTYRKMNAIDENNEIKYDVMKSILAPYVKILHKNYGEDQVTSDAIRFCKRVESNSLGDRLVKLSNCVFTKIDEI